ncbi:MAG: NAD(+)/NADH kinase [Clostridiales bacterium]|nr:NAD(+)/NADH kinase [Clostridiales bacterium]
MNRFFIITNEHRDRDLSVTRSIQDYIESKGGQSSFYVSNKSEWSRRGLRALGAADVEADCIIVLGGDGTLVRAARDMARMEIPLIGVNLGTLGYLCELDMTTVYAAIDGLFEDRYEVEKRMMIEGTGPDEEAAAEPASALNDIVIHRSGGAQLINLILTVNGEYLTTYSADGMIISTPTGSTGYSLSAGGPIVDPRTELLLITPINPQSFTTRSIVVGADAQIEVMLSKRRLERDEEAEVTFDGDHFVTLKVGERIRIRKAAVSAQVMKVNQLSFLQILRSKFQS